MPALAIEYCEASPARQILSSVWNQLNDGCNGQFIKRNHCIYNVAHVFRIVIPGSDEEVIDGFISIRGQIEEFHHSRAPPVS